MSRNADANERLEMLAEAYRSQQAGAPTAGVAPSNPGLVAWLFGGGGDAAEQQQQQQQGGGDSGSEKSPRGRGTSLKSKEAVALTARAPNTLKQRAHVPLSSSAKAAAKPVASVAAAAPPSAAKAADAPVGAAAEAGAGEAALAPAPAPAPAPAALVEFQLNGVVSGALETHIMRRENAMTLNVMVAGQERLGKTTALCSLFGIAKRDEDRQVSGRRTGRNADASLELDMEIIDTPGHHSDDSAAENQQILCSEMKRRFRQYAFNRLDPLDAGRDPRIHLVLYFVPPHRFTDLDRANIEALLPLSNVAVVAAKSDTLLPREREAYKRTIAQALTSERALFGRERSPYAVVAEDRAYAHGTALANNPEHSDMPKLRREVLGSSYQLLQSGTDDRYSVVYEQGGLRNPWWAAKATWVGAAVGLFFGQYAVLKNREHGAEVPPGSAFYLVAGGTGLVGGALYHSALRKLD